MLCRQYGRIDSAVSDSLLEAEKNVQKFTGYGGLDVYISNGNSWLLIDKESVVQLSVDRGRFFSLLVAIPLILQAMFTLAAPLHARRPQPQSMLSSIRSAQFLKEDETEDMTVPGKHLQALAGQLKRTRIPVLLPTFDYLIDFEGKHFPYFATVDDVTPDSYSILITSKNPCDAQYCIVGYLEAHAGHEPGPASEGEPVRLAHGIHGFFVPRAPDSKIAADLVFRVHGVEYHFRVGNANNQKGWLIALANSAILGGALNVARGDRAYGRVREHNRCAQPWFHTAAIPMPRPQS